MIKRSNRGWALVFAALCIGVAAVIFAGNHLRDQTWLTAGESDHLFPRIRNRYEHIEFLRRRDNPKADSALQYQIASTHVKRNARGVLGRVEVIVSLDETHNQRHIDYFTMIRTSEAGWRLSWDVPAWRYYLDCP